VRSTFRRWTSTSSRARSNNRSNPSQGW
jgi:hypothetical protein